MKGWDEHGNDGREEGGEGGKVMASLERREKVKIRKTRGREAKSEGIKVTL